MNPIRRPKLRIIFRGLILYRFERRGTGDAEKLGELYDGPGCQLRALLINDSHGKGVHEHVPQIGVIGRDMKKNEVLLGHREQLSGLGKTVTLSFTPASGQAQGVVRDQSFDEYVPMLSEVYGEMPDPGRRDPSLVAAQVIVPAGLFRAKSLISWTHDFLGPDKNSGAERPVNVEFFWNPSWLARNVASECVLEVPLEEGSPVELLGKQVAPLFNQEPSELKGDEKDWGARIEPNTVDVLVTNFGAQRPIPVPWSVHYQMLFRAAGYQPRRLKATPPSTALEKGFSRFVRAAEAFAAESSDHDAWMRDAHHVHDQGFPIPHISGLVQGMPGSRLDYAMALKDPLNRPICPPALEP